MKQLLTVIAATGVGITLLTGTAQAKGEITSRDALLALQHPATFARHAQAILQLEAGLIDETSPLYGKAIEGACQGRDYFGIQEYESCRETLGG